MNNRYKFYSLLLAAPLFIASCSDDLATPVDNVNGDKEAINICAGISMSQAGVASRALEDFKDGYTAMKKGTQISLVTLGEWKKSTTVTDQIAKNSTATAGDSATVAATTDPVSYEKHYNPLTISSTDSDLLFWDDFGSADPNNKDAGRANGLTMYAAAVNGLSTGGPAINATIADNVATVSTISWDLTTAQNGTDGWSKKDLLISNNIKNDGRYKFANRATAANLIFTHAMSKITVNLMRGDGFTDDEVKNSLATVVSILNMQTKGKVNVIDGSISELGSVNNNNINPKQDFFSNDIAVATAGARFASYSALVMPTNTFGNTKDILKITVNGNTYNVNGTKIIAAAEGNTTSTSHTLKAGTNYVFNIKVSKTGLNITAQIAPWTTYSADETPLLNITAQRKDNYGTANKFTLPFQLYYSDATATKYNTCNVFGAQSPVDVSCTSESSTGSDGKSVTTYAYSFKKNNSAVSLYWPNHTKGYFFRGVVALNDADNAIAKDGSNVFTPTVETDADNGDYITLASGKEEKNNILIGTHANTVANENDANGAIATRDSVRLTFYHKMAQVTVLLRTTTGSDKVTLGTPKIDANEAAGIVGKDVTWADVKVLSYKKDGKVLLGSGDVKATSTTPADYLMPTVTEIYSATADNAFYNRTSYMIPQELTDNMKFQVTVKNEDGTKETYTSKAIKEIEVQKGSATAAKVDKWEPGCKYIYTLNIKKTGLNVTAVLVPWIEYTGSIDVPFM